MSKSLKDDGNLISWKLKALNFVKILNNILKKSYEKLYENFDVKLSVVRNILKELKKIRALY